MADQTSDPQSQVQVRFTTRHADVAVPTAPILVPTTLKRYGLSEVINHLLDTDTPTPFDFLINGSFLRTSLDDYLTQNGLSRETVVDIEYIRAVLPPSHLASYEHPDWVSSVHVREKLVLSGAYDGIARVWNMSGDVVCATSAVDAPLKSVKWVDEGRFVTAGMDRTVRLWEWDAQEVAGEDGAAEARCLGRFKGHSAAIEDLAVTGNNVLSAGADGVLNFYSLNTADQKEASEDEDTGAQRKRRRTAKSAPQAPSYSPLLTLPQSESSSGANPSPLSATIFAPESSELAYSASWDHSVRTYDLPTATLLSTITPTSHPLLSLCALPSIHLLAAGTASRTITLIDPRAGAATTNAGSLTGHTGMVVSVCQNGQSYGVNSASHDGTVRVWDVRAMKGAIHVLRPRQEGKMFAVDGGEMGIVGGGEGKRIEVWSDVEKRD
ncbi:ribosome bioproteinsis protein ytm1 [Saitoella coloradoensis]